VRKNKERKEASPYFTALALLSFFSAEARPQNSTSQQLVLQETRSDSMENSIQSHYSLLFVKHAIG
jgi:hypothetical protein